MKTIKSKFSRISHSLLVVLMIFQIILNITPLPTYASVDDYNKYSLMLWMKQCASFFPGTDNKDNDQVSSGDYLANRSTKISKSNLPTGWEDTTAGPTTEPNEIRTNAKLYPDIVKLTASNDTLLDCKEISKAAIPLMYSNLTAMITDLNENTDPNGPYKLSYSKLMAKIDSTISKYQANISIKDTRDANTAAMEFCFTAHDPTTEGPNPKYGLFTYEIIEVGTPNNTKKTINLKINTSNATTENDRDFCKAAFDIFKKAQDKINEEITKGTLPPEVSKPPTVTPVTPGNGSGSTGSSGTGDDLSQCISTDTFTGWVVCPILEFTDSISNQIYGSGGIKGQLQIPDLETFADQTTGTVYNGWQIFRVIGNAFLVSMLLMALFAKAVKGS